MVIAPAPAKPAGLSERREPQYRVTNPIQIAAARPDLVTIAPKAREIAAATKLLGQFDGERELCAGLTVWWESKAVVR